MTAANLKKKIQSLLTALAAASGVAMLAVAGPATAAENAAIQPFKVSIPEKELADLRSKIAATRWPTKELVDDRSQGVQLATMRELARYWSTDYDWRKAEATAERAAAVHHRDRRREDPLHPRQVQA